MSINSLLPEKPDDLADLERQISALEHGFNQAQREFEHKAEMEKLRSEFDQKLEAATEWISDQLATLAMMKTVPAMEMILEPQKLQVCAIQKESQKRRSRVERLREISKSLNNEKSSDIESLESDWDRLDGDLESRKQEIEEIVAILNALEQTSQKTSKFSADTSHLLAQSFAKITPTEKAIEKLKQTLCSQKALLEELNVEASQAFDATAAEMPDFDTNGRVKSKIQDSKTDLHKTKEALNRAADDLEILDEKIKIAKNDRDSLSADLSAAKNKSDLSKDDVDSLKSDFDEFVARIDEISELAGRPTDLRDDKRKFMGELADLSKLVDEKARDQARRAKKTKLLQDMIADFTRQLESTKVGETTPEAVRRKQALVCQVIAEIESKEAEFSHLVEFDQLQLFADEVRLRRSELEDCFELSNELFNETKLFNDYFDRSIRYLDSTKTFDSQKLQVHNCLLCFFYQ